ncbi:thiamine pyrophosphate-dependent enzyme [Muricoccus radiodurans]|uniref:thiamine pyrophosphate-dependent enzyme n=1 Tax=Muricoccus radiodurans TaxID=2231721 RepID=UPI003CF80B3E
MNSQEMETAVRLGLNLVVLVLDEGAYDMIRWKQSADDFTSSSLSTFLAPARSDPGRCAMWRWPGPHAPMAKHHAPWIDSVERHPSHVDAA